MSIILNNLTSIYAKGTPAEYKALDGVDLTIERGRTIAVIGPTGSGKSTLALHMNGLLIADEGAISVDGIEIRSGSKELREVRRRVGVVFQYPEQGFFCDTVREEIAFSPRCWGKSEEEIESAVERAASLLGLPEDALSKDPLTLSGGMRRRAAIASVISSEPDYLVLDEPTAGLDASGARRLLDMIDALKEQGSGVVLITHDLDAAFAHADGIAALDAGRLAYYDRPIDAALAIAEGRVPGMAPPPLMKLAHALRAKGSDVELDASIDVLIKEVKKWLSQSH